MPHLPSPPVPRSPRSSPQVPAVPARAEELPMTATVDRTEPDLVPDLSDPTAGRVAQAREMASAQVQMIADPAPLGLAAFALTTFLLSLANSGLMPVAAEPVVF